MLFFFLFFSQPLLTHQRGQQTQIGNIPGCSIVRMAFCGAFPADAQTQKAFAEASPFLVKQKRPHEVAKFLKQFAVEDRHEVVNLLLVLGLKQYYQHRAEELRAARLQLSTPVGGDSDMEALRFLRDMVSRSHSPTRRVSSRNAAVPGAADAPNATSASASKARSPGSRGPSPPTVHRSRSPRCVKCYLDALTGVANTTSSAQASPPSTSSRSSGVIREQIQRDKKAYYEQRSGSACREDGPQFELRQSDHPHQTNDAKVASAVEADAQADQAVPDVFAPGAVLQTATTPSCRVSERIERQQQQRTWALDAVAATDLRFDAVSGSHSPRRSGSNDAQASPQPAGAHHENSRLLSMSSKRLSSLSDQTESSHQNHLVGDTCDSVGGSLLQSLEVGPSEVAGAAADHNAVVCDASDRSAGGPTAEPSKQHSMMPTPEHQELSAPSADLPVTKVPPSAVTALWSFVLREHGARRNPLIVAAALSPADAALVVSPEFEEIYRSLLLAYHLQKQV